MDVRSQRSFGRRVLLLSLVSAGAALLLATIGFVLNEYLSSRNEIRERLGAIALVVADNGAAALAFRDEKAANDVLATLRSVPEVSRATLFGGDGRAFAVHPRAAPPAPPEPRPGQARVEFEGDRVLLRQPVRLEREAIGHLLVEADLHRLYVRLAWYAIASLALVAVALAASTLLLGALRRRLTRTEGALAELTGTLEARVAERTAELERANRELESFAYSVSHDLRAPARAMAGYAGILREDFGPSLPAEALRSLGRIEESAMRMGRLIDDLLELSRAGRTVLTPVRVDMRALASSVARDLGNAAAGAEVQIGALPEVEGDETLLRQVWSNLIQNALKFSRHAAAPRIEVGATPGPGRIEYFVSDNGAGFEMQYVHKLFGVFERLHTPSEYEGTGVGLAIVQRIVERHGGAVSAEGAPGKGATFRFTLPVRGDGRGPT